jgi:hypothetical protein
MPATVTLSTTALQVSAEAGDRQVRVASTSGLTAGVRLFVGTELMSVVSLGVSNWVNVLRGVDGTAAQHHDAGETIYIGRAHQFYGSDPAGAPPEAIPVSPYINVVNGTIWYAQGDTRPAGQAQRWWQKQSATYGVGALGVRTVTLDPTSST